MFERIGLPELVIILVIILLLFGSSKLPQMGHALGKSVNMFKKGLNETDDTPKTPEASTDSVAKATEASQDGAVSTPQAVPIHQH